ncbi:MAG TPA: CGNR zinc finger domain-containing protein [Actinocrinis sp.]|nr:CGNR zinc finger domain-containing protein [Actinocrinis sp.]
MELASYADRAVQLVNTFDPYRGQDYLTTVDQVRTLLDRQGACGAVGPGDLLELRAMRDCLRTLFESVDAGVQQRAVDLLNQLLERYPIRPQVSGHDDSDWHLHLAENAPSTAAAYGSKACMGLAVQATEIGLDRLGVCQAAPCRDVFIDTSTNRSRRYCSERCATRANVAAYRARRREAASAAAPARPQPAEHAAEDQLRRDGAELTRVA